VAKRLSLSHWKFLLPSAAGIVIFLVPIIDADRQTIVFSLLTDALRAALQPILLQLLYGLITVAAIGSLVYRIGNPLQRGSGIAREAFAASWGWILLRLSGFLVASCVVFDIGPQLLRLEDTGIVVMMDIGINMMLIMIVGLICLPLLTEYGLMEFIGSLLGRRFQRWFRLPGRAAIDMSASLVSASAVGLIVTIGQYERGYYSARQAAVIACSFSIVSLPFCVLIAQVAGIEAHFFGWYVTVLFACLLTAVVLARIPPLSGYPDDYHNAAGNTRLESDKSAFEAALARAASGPGIRRYLQLVALSMAQILPGVVAPAMGLATAAAILVFHTPIFGWLALPVQWFLELLSVAEAPLIAPGFLAGYLDQFMPALLAQSVASEFWRFVLAGLAVTQLVFLSEFGVLVLRSSLPVNLADLTAIFIERTVISAPLLAIGAWFFV
jgi:nucleoside recognition membrane protein YjiH